MAPPRSIDASIPSELEAICLECLTHDPARRPRAAEVASRLEAFGSESASGAAPARGRRAPTVLALLLVLAAVGGAAFLVARVVAPTTPRPAPSRLPAGFTRVFELGRGPAPALEPGVLWTDERTAEPLVGLRQGRGAGLDAAFAGKVTPGAGGRVTVAYDLTRAGRARVLLPARAFVNGTRLTGVTRPSDAGAGIQVEEPDDAGGLSVAVGHARWASAVLSFRFEVRAEPHLMRWLTVLSRTFASESAVSFRGREDVAVVGTAVAPSLRLGDRSHDVVLAVGGPAGQRLRLDGLPVPGLDAALAAPWPPSPVRFDLDEGVFTLSHLVVTGLPVRADVAAQAAAPAPLPPTATVRASFAADAPVEGGPFVALGEVGGDQLVLELDGPALVLRHGVATLASASVGLRTRGTLVLERAADELRGRFEDGAGTVHLEACDPLPLSARATRGLWGSTAGRVRFEEVEVLAGPAEPERDALDRAARGSLPAALGVLEASRGATSFAEARRRHRLGALRLHRAWDPVERDVELQGDPERWREAGRLALDDLRAAVDGLAPAAASLARRDARARGVLAALIAHDADAAAAVARGLMAEAGADGRRRVEALVRTVPSFTLERLLENDFFDLPHDPGFVLAWIAAAEHLLPARRGAALLSRASILANPREDGQPRRATEEEASAAVRIAREALDAGADPVRTNDLLAGLLVGLGRYEEALAAHEVYLPTCRTDAYQWQRRATILAGLDRPEDAVEALVVALACAPTATRRDSSGGAIPLAEVTEAEARRLGPAKAGGLTAAAMVACAHATGKRGLIETARLDAGNMHAPGWSELHRDLARYAIAVSGTVPDLPEDAPDRPGLALARARVAPTPAARARLAAAGERCPIVWALARLDPVFQR